MISIQDFFKQRNAIPKKELGQNFLKDSFYLNKIGSEVLKLATKLNSTVCELGAGTGSLTSVLLEKKLKVLAIEKDQILFDFLKKHFLQQISKGFLKVRKTDILEFLDELEDNTLICGNIPYNLTSSIILKLIKHRKKLTAIVITIQEEVARKILSSPQEPNYGSFAILVQTFFSSGKICEIPFKAFYPSPKVNSTTICLLPKKENLEINENEFSQFLIEFFSKKRKNISHFFKKKENKKFCFDDFNISLNIRPENLTVDTFLKIFLN